MSVMKLHNIANNVDNAATTMLHFQKGWISAKNNALASASIAEVSV